MPIRAVAPAVPAGAVPAVDALVAVTVLAMPRLTVVPPSGIRLPEVSIVLPAYNEEHGVAAVLDGLAGIMTSRMEILVVDDGSDDGTARVAAGRGARVVRHARNQGKAAALRTGFREAQGHLLVTLDADGTYPVTAIPSLVAALEDGAGLVIGARRVSGASMNRVHRAGNRALRVAIGLSAGRHVSDPLSGMYGIRRELLDRLTLRSEGFGIETELVVRAGRAGARIQEIEVVYGARIGTSKLSPLRDGLAISRTLIGLGWPGWDMIQRRTPITSGTDRGG